jgi:glycosyltransferase involved in cell wall biosynthesis
MGRIDPQKNQHFVVDAFPQLLRLVPDAHLVFIGHVTNEPYCEELRRRIGELDQPQRVTVITGLDAGSTDLVDAYHAADVFVLPSLHEPFGIVILEAWAAGRPVVASRVGGVASLVADSEDGLLFDAHDQQGFLRACTAILDRPEYRRQLADRGQRKARQQYGWDTITRRLLEIYEEVVRESHLRQ